MKKRRYRYLLIIPILFIIVFIFLFKRGSTLARYMSDSSWNVFFKTNEFYLSSDYLDTEVKTNVNNIWDGNSVHFNIRNNLNNEVASGYDITYEVTCNIIGDPSTHTKCNLNGTESNVWEGTLTSTKYCFNSKGDSIDVSSYTEEQCISEGYTLKNGLAEKDSYFDIVLTDQNYVIDSLLVNISVEAKTPYTKTITGNFILNKVVADNGTMTKSYTNYSNYDRLNITNTYTTDKCISISWNSDNLLLDEKLTRFSSNSSDLNGYTNNVEITITSKSSESFIFRSRNVENTYNISEFTITESC